MRQLVVACALTATFLLVPTLPAAADEQDDAFAACVKELAGHEGISRNLLKNFRINKFGNGFEVTGQDENGQSVSCKTNGTRVTHVSVG
jgi:hypothetical protein